MKQTALLGLFGLFALLPTGLSLGPQVQPGGVESEIVTQPSNFAVKSNNLIRTQSPATICQVFKLPSAKTATARRVCFLECLFPRDGRLAKQYYSEMPFLDWLFEGRDWLCL